MVHRFLLVSRELEDRLNSHNHQGDDEGAPERSHHDDDASEEAEWHEVAEAHGRDRHNDDPDGLEVVIEVYLPD